jgi:hypothetical protein
MWDLSIEKEGGEKDNIGWRWVSWEMTRSEWEGREEATKDGRQGNPEIGEK